MNKFFGELDKLAILVAVREKGKINEAAEILGLSQPSVSRAIQKLEEAFGTPIFIRSRDGVSLTPAGLLLADRASRMLRELEDIQVQGKNVDHELSGKLTIGSYESLAEYLWPEFLLKLEEKHPALQLSVRTNLNQNPLVELMDRKIDLMVDAEPQTKNDLVSWPLYSDKFAFYISSKRREHEFSQVSMLGETISFVQGAYDEDRFTIENHLEERQYRFARTYCFDSFSTAKLMAIRGGGIAVLPKRLASEAENNKVIKRVTVKGFGSEGFGRHTIYATVISAFEKDARIKSVIALLKGHLK